MNGRDFFLRALVVFGIAVVAISELGLLRRGPLVACWLAVLVGGIIVARNQKVRFSFDPIILSIALNTAGILALTALTAALNPPNSADAMAYHLPRVIYWAEQASVRFFPTPYLNQIMLQPMAEYMMLQTYVLSGGDHLVNFAQWFASLAAIVGVSAVAAKFRVAGRGQAVAALFCATIPSGVLASTGAKNDYVLAMWMIAAVYFALSENALFLGGALGLALLTKATAYLFLPWPLAAILILKRRFLWAAIPIALLINTPQYVRNYGLSGSIMGFDSAQGDGFFRWRNETFGWKQTASNILRNASEQMGARSKGWNQGVYDVVVNAHKALGIDVNDPRTTWRWTSFAPPVNANHEANAPNGWHLLLLIAVCASIRRRDRWLYTVALFCGFLAFCFYLKWQPFQARLFLPLLVLSAPLIDIRRWWLQLVVCLMLLGVARRPLLDNWTRPLIPKAPRDSLYFADMKQWNNQASFERAAALLVGSNCRTVGIDITNLQLEYPLQALLRERKPGTDFVHTGVQNASERYRPPIDAAPCAVACLDCAGDAKRLSLYKGFPDSETIGRFVIFLRYHPAIP